MMFSSQDFPASKNGGRKSHWTVPLNLTEDDLLHLLDGRVLVEPDHVVVHGGALGNGITK